MRQVGTRHSVLDRAEKVLSEHVEQREFVKWFRQTFDGVRIMSVPNGGHRNLATAARLKAEGAVSGVPDLFVPEWGLWIEMKRAKGGKVSPAQKDWHQYLQDCGYCVIVCNGCTDAINQTQNFRKQ